MGSSSSGPLPPPPAGKSGWPWQEASSQPGIKREKLPRITIITPSFNQGIYLEESIRSVLLQGYPNLEYMIFDGGSSDDSVRIIQKYAPWLSFWVSEPDRGQAHAINRGFERASGNIVAWLNSDDLLLPGALMRIAEAHRRQPHAIILGDVENFCMGDHVQANITHQHNVTLRHLLTPCKSCVRFRYLQVSEYADWRWHQPGTFVPHGALLEAGPLDESLHYAFDKDWIFRLLQLAPVHYLRHPVSRFRIHDAQKTSADFAEFVRESYVVNRRYMHLVPDAEHHYLEGLYNFRLATIYLVQHADYAHCWNRWRGMQALFSAVVHYPKILCEPVFQRLCLRVLLPRVLWRSPTGSRV